MDFQLSEEHRMLKDLAERFVRDELMPLEGAVLARDTAGQGIWLSPDEQARIDEVSKKLGLWGLDAPEDVGGFDLPQVALIGVNEALGSTITPYTLPPDSPNLRMLMATVTERQREAADIRAQGSQLSQTIRARADRDVTVLRAEATRKADELRGNGEAERNRVLADAFGADPSFFSFWRSMQAYEASMKSGDTRMVLSPDSEFFRYFGRSTSQPNGAAAKDQQRLEPPKPQ